MILSLGDFVRHGLASLDKRVNNWEKMWPIISAQMSLIHEKFPETVVLPTLGNNDQIHHYQVPGYQDLKKKYYSHVHEMWFGKYAPRANQEFSKYLKEDILNGGYYRFDLDGITSESKISIISLNTIYFHRKNYEDADGSER